MMKKALLALTALVLTTLTAHAVQTNPRSCGGAIRHVHLAVGKDPSSEMTVSFASIPSKYEDAPVGAVWIATSASQLTGDGNSETPLLFIEHHNTSPTHYNVSSIHGHNYEDNMYYSPYYHHVTVTGLRPSTTYYYKPVVEAKRAAFGKYQLLQSAKREQDEQEEEEDAARYRRRRRLIDDKKWRRRRLIQWGPYDGSDKPCPSMDQIRSFTTAPAVGDLESPLQLAIIGDIGQFPHSEESLARMLQTRNELHAVILAGDVAYTEYDHRRWDTFFDFLDDYPIAQHVPLQIVPGNHDIDKQDNGTGIFEAYEHRFRMPRVRPPMLGQFDGPLGLLNMDRPPYPLPYEWGNAYYSFKYGMAHFVMISSYSAMEPNSTQYKWILHELRENVNRTETPWLIAVLHTPLYNTFSLHQHDDQIVAAKEHLEPLFVEYEVNFVYSGHIHAYLRTAPVVNAGQLHPKGPIHITIGSGGRKCEAPFINKDPEPWVEVRDATIYGYGLLTLHNSTHAEWDWIHTGHNDDREFNEWDGHPNATLPPGPGRDWVIFENQYYLKEPDP